MGVKVNFVQTDWDTIIPDLIAHKFDIIICDYNNAKISPSLLSTLEDFNNPNIRIGVRLGTTAEDAVQNYTPKAKAVIFKSEDASVKALLNGEISCLMLSQPLPKILVKKYP
ncbi:transporter substrate-binding domain-containing protein, partial [Aduncisulcus paluster]